MSQKIKYLVVILIAFTQISIAQQGAPFITNFFTENESLNENFSICEDADGEIIIANRRGILTFNADEWNLIKTPEIPLTVALNSDTRQVFVGCRNSAGILIKNSAGQYLYSTLKLNATGVVTQILFTNTLAYFISSEFISCVNLNTLKPKLQIEAEKGNTFLTAFINNNNLYVSSKQNGLTLLQNGILTAVNTKINISQNLAFAIPYNNNTTFIGTTNNNLYLFSPNKLQAFKIQDQQYINNGNLFDARLLDNNKIVIATATAGCLVIDKESGKTLFTINYQIGLPDDEVLAIGTDRNHGIWVSHNYGLSRVDSDIPVKNFSTFKGIQGNMQTAGMYNNTLYVTSGNGVYYLDKKKDYVEYKVKSNIRSLETSVPTSANLSDKSISNSETTTPQPAPVRKSIFARLFGKKENVNQNLIENSTINTNNNNNQVPQTNLISISPETTTKKVYKLQSESHYFVKIKGIEHKSRQILFFKNKLIIATINGVFEIFNNNAVEIIKNQTINYLYITYTGNELYVCTNNGIEQLILNGNKWQTIKFPVAQTEPVYSFAKDMFDNYWIGVENKAYKIKLNRDNTAKETKVYSFSAEFHERVIVRISNKKPLFFLNNSIYSIFNDSVQQNIMYANYNGSGTKFYFTQPQYTWINNNSNWLMLSATSAPDSIFPNNLNIFSNINSISVDQKNNVWVIDNNTSLYQLSKSEIINYKSDFSAFIKSFTGIQGQMFSLSGSELNKNNHSLKIHISAPYYIKSNSNQYQYFVKGVSSNWTGWSPNPVIDFFALKSGNYELMVRAKNIFGNVSNQQTLKFRIKPSFYETWWFILFCVLFCIASVWFIIKYREKALIRENLNLEEKVKERTRQIEEQKKEIEAQRDLIAGQNLEITDSIRYAKRIQTAVMPTAEVLNTVLNNYFVLFKPKDIVSGDFYWVNQKNNKIVVIAADCTGHGVPGGFLSMLGISLLNEIAALNNEFNANELLNVLRLKLKLLLTQEGHEETKDGMDIALCIIDKPNKQLQYAGANNPIYIIRNNELIEYHADKMPIGVYIGEKESFTNNNIQLQKNDVLYMFTDGYRDQFGGPQAKRLKSGPFRKLLLEANQQPLNKQKQFIEQKHSQWRGNSEQVDDILIIGIKID